MSIVGTRPPTLDEWNKYELHHRATASGNELFVLGRNIYQAADGNCYACHRFIDGFSENSKIPTQAKLHILNGMACLAVWLAGK